MSEREPNPDELDRLVDGLFADGARVDDGHALLEVARRIRSLADEPIPTDVRDRHLVALRRAATEQLATNAPAAGWTAGWLAGVRRRAAAVAAATGLAFTAAGGGAVALAQDADPDDDLLYGVKRASEQVALAVSRDDAQLHLRFAERRLDEIDAAPGHAADLADAAARQIELAQENGADLSEAGVAAVQRLSEVVTQLENENARIAVSRACARIAERRGGGATACGYDGVSRPGRSGEAPGRSGDEPGRSGHAPGSGSDAPGRSGEAPGRDGNAPGTTDAPGRSGEAPGRDGNAPGTTGTDPSGSG